MNTQRIAVSIKKIHYIFLAHLQPIWASHVNVGWVSSQNTNNTKKKKNIENTTFFVYSEIMHALCLV